MPTPAPIAVRETKAAQMLDLPVSEFRRLVAVGALPKGRELAPGIVRWNWGHIEAIRRGLTMDHPPDTHWRDLILALEYEGRTNRYISDEIKNEVSMREGVRCTYCGCEDEPLEYDHIFPVSRGGTNAASNLTLACRKCNSSKRGKTLREWMQRDA